MNPWLRDVALSRNDAMGSDGAGINEPKNNSLIQIQRSPGKNHLLAYLTHRKEFGESAAWLQRSLGHREKIQLSLANPDANLDANLEAGRCRTFAMRAYCRVSSTSNVKHDNITLNLAVPLAMRIYFRGIFDSRHASRCTGLLLHLQVIC